jgi:cobaltochelatase CobN
MLEAVRKGYWKPDKRVVQKLAVEYAMNVIEKGVACCDHTCNNPMLNQMVVNFISIPGVMSPELVQKFKAIITKATGKKLDKAVKEREQLLKKISDVVKDMRKKNVNGKMDATKKVKGYELKKETKKEDSQATSSGVQWYLMIFVFAIILTIVAGIIKRRKKID